MVKISIEMIHVSSKDALLPVEWQLLTKSQLVYTSYIFCEFQKFQIICVLVFNFNFD